MKTFFIISLFFISAGVLKADIIDMKIYTPFSMSIMKPPVEMGSVFSSDGETVTFKQCHTSELPIKSKSDCGGTEYILGKKQKVLEDLTKKLSGDRKIEHAKLIAEETMRMLEKGDQRIVEKEKKLTAEPELDKKVTVAEIAEATKLLIGFKVVFPDKWNDGKILFDNLGNCKVSSSCSPPAKGVNYDHCLKIPISDERKKCIERALIGANQIGPDITDRILRDENCRIELSPPKDSILTIGITRKFKDSVVERFPDDSWDRTYDKCFAKVQDPKVHHKKVDNSERTPKDVLKNSGPDSKESSSGSRQ